MRFEKILKCLIFLCLLLFAFLAAKISGKEQYKEMLYKNGYLTSMKANNQEFKAAIKKFQKMAGTEETGEMDGSATEAFKKPRCGRAHYLRHEDKWGKTKLTYKIRNVTVDLSISQVKEAFERVAAFWTHGVNLEIRESQTATADIDIYFSPQDGTSEVLGYAYFPENGDIYFDAFEKWVAAKKFTSDEIKFLWVAAHELGHALGLEHNDKDRNSIMYPFYSDEVSFVSKSDKRRLLNIYGKSENLDNSILCHDHTVDAMFKFSDGTYILAKDQNGWIITESGLQSGPFELTSLFPCFPSNIDAAFSKGNDFFFFKDNAYYKYGMDNMHPRQKLINIGFENVPNNLNASLYMGTSKLAFYAGDKYYEFHGKKPVGTRMVINGKKLSSMNIPSNLNAALLFEGSNKIMFVKGNKYYFFNVKKNTMGEALDLKKKFFKC